MLPVRRVVLPKDFVKPYRRLLQCVRALPRIPGEIGLRSTDGEAGDAGSVVCQSEQNLGGEAFVGELDAPEIAGGVENLDAQFEAAVEFAGAHADHAEFLGLL